MITQILCNHGLPLNSDCEQCYRDYEIRCKARMLAAAWQEGFSAAMESCRPISLNQAARLLEAENPYREVQA